MQPLITSWREARQWTLERDGRMCLICRATTDLSLHHCVPRHLCRDDWPRNLTTLCRTCHDLIEQLDQLSAAYHWIDLYLQRTAAQKGY